MFAPTRRAGKGVTRVGPQIVRVLTTFRVRPAAGHAKAVSATHLGNIQTRLPARNRAEIAAWAWRSGIEEE